MRRFALLTALLLLSPGLAQAADRNVSLVASFRTLCTAEPPQFSHIEQKAAALGFAVRQEVGQSKVSGVFAHSKSWEVPQSDGPYDLLVAEANDTQGHITSCGISAADADGEGIRQALVSQLRLGQPAAENLSPEGTLRTILWKDVFGPGSVLQFVDGSPQQQSGAMVYYLTIGPMLP